MVHSIEWFEYSIELFGCLFTWKCPRYLLKLIYVGNLEYVEVLDDSDDNTSVI